jgi:phosphoenolpyruvate carboxylase
VSDAIKTSAYFQEGFRELDQTLADSMRLLAKALPCEPELQELVPWQSEAPYPTSIAEGKERQAAQLLSISFELLNIVEERVAWQFRGKRRTEHGAAAIKGLWPAVISRFVSEGLSEDEALTALRKVHIEPVLTAHPTEAKRPSVREKHLAIYETLRTYESSRQDPHYGQRLADSLAAEFESLWFTGEIFVQRPDVQDELRNALYYLRDVFPAVVLRLDRSLELAWQDAGWDPARLRNEDALPTLRFTTWIGGDRDGHPFVTPEVTKSTLAELRRQALLLHGKHLDAAAKNLTLATPFIECPAPLSEAIAPLLAELGEDAEDILHHHDNEPWCLFLRLLRKKMAAGGYQHCAEYKADLTLAHDTLIAAGASRTAKEWVAPLLRLADIFGFHLAALDVRNNSEAHDEAAAQLLATAEIPDAENFATWPEQKRREVLLAELQNPRPIVSRYQESGDKIDHVLSYLRLLATHRRRFGTDGLGQLIISMTRSVSDLMLAQVLAKEAGLADRQSNGLWRSQLPVSPLFETGEDLDASSEILREYLEALGAHPSGLQPAMVGYSDSNKDAGVFTSQWCIFKGQEAMTHTCRDFGVTPQFFHGRGGTIGRGAGPTQWFLRALPQGSLTGPIRITEQGEVLPRKYAHEGNAHYHLELLVAGVARVVALQPDHSETLEDCRPAFDLLSAESTRAYRALLERDGFISFHRAATPIDALETGTFGSRPSRRTGKKERSLSDLRAIPWVFSWTQARFYLPGWFGVGSGLTALAEIAPNHFAKLQAAAHELPFLRYVLTNVESSLASANLALMTDYAQLCEDTTIRDNFLEHITTEFDLTRHRVADLLGGDFSKRRPRMQKTLALREDPLRFLHHQQIHLLRKWRDGGSVVETSDGKFDKTFLALQLNINAISSGLRETG